MAMVPVQVLDDDRLVALWLHGKSAATQRAYAADSQAFRAYVDKSLPMVTIGDLQDYADSLSDQKKSSQARRLAVAKSLLGFGHRLNYVALPIGSFVKPPKRANDLAERIVPQEQIKLMIEMEARPRNHVFLHLLYQAGLRLSEALGLRWRDAKRRLETEAGGKAARGRKQNKIAGQLTVFGKGGKTRFVTVGPNLWRKMQALRQDAGEDDFVFRTASGSQIGLSRGHAIVKRAAARAGLPEAFSAHWCRHAHASHALDAGEQVHVLQATLGHASLRTTSTYVHVRPDQSSSRFLPD